MIKLYIIILIMNKYLPKNRTTFISFIATFIIIPIFNLILASKQSLIYENYTNLSTTHPLLFISYGISVSLTYYYIYTHLNYHHKYLSLLATTLSIISFFLPYHKNNIDLISHLHVVFALTSTIISLVLILINIKSLATTNYYLFNKYLKFISLITIMLFTLMIIIMDISGLLELILTQSIACLLYSLLINGN